MQKNHKTMQTTRREQKWKNNSLLLVPGWRTNVLKIANVSKKKSPYLNLFALSFDKSTNWLYSLMNFSVTRGHPSIEHVLQVFIFVVIFFVMCHGVVSLPPVSQQFALLPALSWSSFSFRHTLQNQSSPIKSQCWLGFCRDLAENVDL